MRKKMEQILLEDGGIIYSGIWDQYASLHQTAEGYLASRSAGGNRGNQ